MSVVPLFYHNTRQKIYKSLFGLPISWQVLPEKALFRLGRKLMKKIKTKSCQYCGDRRDCETNKVQPVDITKDGYCPCFYREDITALGDLKGFGHNGC